MKIIREPVFAGIDVGSLTAKAVLVDKGGILSHAIIDTGANPEKAGKTVFDKALGKAGYRREEVRQIVGTGYGRVSLSFVDKAITELTCHAKGVRYLNRGIMTVIDIGGQDSKVIRLNRDGSMADFAMNDRCAAGTGRFLEVMARALEVGLEELGRISLRSRKPSLINSMCTVFAESEVISLLASGEEKEDVAAGLHLGIAKRVGNLAKRLGIKERVGFVGGVAKNKGLRDALESFLGIGFAPIVEDPQITGALGAAVLASETHG